MPAIRAVELHPIIVHFPIALLLTSVVMDFVAAFTRRWNIADVGTWLLLFGVIGALAAGLTGNLSEHQAGVAHVGNLLALHKTFGFAAGASFALLLAVRLVWLAPRILLGLRGVVPALAGPVERRLRVSVPALFVAPPKTWMVALYLVGSVGAAVLLGITGYLGGALVYDHGLGTPGAALVLLLHAR
jgi:uncharacterized membrane protein